MACMSTARATMRAMRQSPLNATIHARMHDAVHATMRANRQSQLKTTMHAMMLVDGAAHATMRASRQMHATVNAVMQAIVHATMRGRGNLRCMQQATMRTEARKYISHTRHAPFARKDAQYCSEFCCLMIE